MKISVLIQWRSKLPTKIKFLFYNFDLKSAIVEKIIQILENYLLSGSIIDGIDSLSSC